VASEPDEASERRRLFARPAPLVIGLEPTRSILHVSPSFHIASAEPPPGWWHRWWHWALLGWWWEAR